MKRQSNTAHNVNRRSFIKTVGSAAVATASAPMLFDARFAHAAPTAKSAAESVVGEFYNSLSEKQMAEICFRFNHGARRRINPNWHVTEPLIGSDFYSDSQRAMINQIIKNITSETGYERLQAQVVDDDGGIEAFSVAVFGEPGKGKFQWELTGRHLTLRADGDSVDRAAFGGPLVYGHGESNPKDNVYHYQTKQANKVFEALDPKQAKQALVSQSPQETHVQLQGEKGTFPGIPVSELSDDQKQLVEDSIRVLLAPYREEDVDEAMAILKASGGMDSLRMAFYQDGDIGQDRVWDNWRIEGPSLVWHFRGDPHVHAYINIGQAKS